MAAEIKKFLDERKSLWLKDRVKKAKNEQEILDLKQQADDRFHLTHWLPDAAKRVTQLNMVSHVSKFSHPSAKTSNIIANTTALNDGYVRSGNVEYALDVFGNAAAMDVYKFLSLPLSDEKTVLEGFETDDTQLVQLFTESSLDFNVFKHAFLKIKQSEESVKTDYRVKQVYFPIGEGEYHLLSILTPSGLISELKSKIDFIRFSEKSKQAKESRKKAEHDAQGYDDIYDLTITSYGGTQPQNVSVLNSQNAGRAYLLSSCPPVLAKRQLRLPTTDFFEQCLYRKSYQESFLQLHRFMLLDINNMHIKTAIENILIFIIDQVVLYALKIREFSEVGWSNRENYTRLPKLQRVWLDDFYKVHRLDDTSWRDEICQDIARWLTHSYENSMVGTYTLGKVELDQISVFAKKSLEKTKGIL